MVYDARKALLPTYSVLDGAKALLESHRIGKGIVGGVGARAFLPGKTMYDTNDTATAEASVKYRLRCCRWMQF